MSKNTLVIGASTNPSRYSHLAINSLRKHNHKVFGLGLRKGKVADVEIEPKKIDYQEIDTVTLYVGPKNQPAFYEYIESLKPRRVIFNPGTENDHFENQLRSKGIIVLRACTLVLLSTRQY